MRYRSMHRGSILLSRHMLQLPRSFESPCTCMPDRIIASTSWRRRLELPLRSPMERHLCNGRISVDKSHTTGFQTIGVGDQVFLNKSSHYWNSTVFMNASNVILDFYIAFVPGGEAQIRNHTKPFMMECMCQWCVKTFETSYSTGFLKETVLSTQLPQDRDPTTATEGLAYPADGPYVLMAAG
jgi:hypothetical protein